MYLYRLFYIFNIKSIHSNDNSQYATAITERLDRGEINCTFSSGHGVLLYIAGSKVQISLNFTFQLNHNLLARFYAKLSYSSLNT